jgi:hypothetical protein
VSGGAQGHVLRENRRFWCRGIGARQLSRYHCRSGVRQRRHSELQACLHGRRTTAGFREPAVSARGAWSATDRFGTLDPTDGGRSQRASLSALYHRQFREATLPGSAFIEYNQLHIYNDFTHFLVDSVHGDQEVQFENRRVTGGAVSYCLPLPFGRIDN